MTASVQPAQAARLAMLEATHQSTPDLVAMLALDGSVLEANRAALAFAGISLVEASSAPLWTSPGWSARPALAAWLASSVSGAELGRPTTRVETVTLADGPSCALQFTVRLLSDTGSGASWLHLTSVDITDQARALAALRDSEARFRAALDAGFDAFVIVQAVRDATGAIADFVVVDASARAGRLVSLPVSALIGRPLLDAFPQSQETGLWEQCEQVVNTRVPFVMAQGAPLPTVPGRWVQRQIVPLATARRFHRAM